MISDKKHLTLLFSVSVFVIFFSYYFVTSNLLPRGAGPDWKSNTDVASFIYEHGRLAVLPDDEEHLHFTVYGGTRALRPPLSYIVSALAARALSFTDIDNFRLFRKGSAVLCALAVTLAFYALSIYFSHYGIGLLGASIIGLMPQYTFIASYTNDDSGAIFTATLMLAVLVRIYRYGASTVNAVLAGLAGGLVVLSKMSAWLLMPFALLGLLAFFRAPLRPKLRYAIIALLVFVVAGGWWIGFNMYHYGLDDPLVKKVTTQAIEQHRRLPPDRGVGFAAQGIGYYELIFENYKNYLGETARATIGNMDWLKLRVGPLQYTFYLLVFWLAMAYYLFSVLEFARARFGHTVGGAQARRVLFESLLMAIVLFQFFMYTWTNIHNDIQIQGKYLIPVFLAILLLFFSAIERLSKSFTAADAGFSRLESVFSSRILRSNLLLLLALLIIGYVHWHAWVNFVIPFYKPPVYDMTLGEIKTVPLAAFKPGPVRNLEISARRERIVFASTGSDPQAIMHDGLCRYLSGTVLLRLSMTADQSGTLQLFIDEGEGFSADRSYTADYRAGDNDVVLAISSGACRRVRFDPAVDSGTLTLQAAQAMPITIRRRDDDD